MEPKNLLIQATLILMLSVCAESRAGQLGSLDDLPDRVLSETSSSDLFAPQGLAETDYQIEWIGPPIDGVEPVLEAQSLEWVRVEGIFRMPRARVHLRIRDADRAQLQYRGSVVLLEQGAGEVRQWQARFSILLLSSAQNKVDVVLVRGQREIRGAFRLRFKPVLPASVKSSDQETKIFVDASCSPFLHNTPSPDFPKDVWVYLSCRMVGTQSSDGTSGNLEVFALWDNVDPELRVNGLRSKPVVSSMWRVRVPPGAQSVRFQIGSVDVSFSALSPRHLSLLNLGAGLGPYLYRYR